MSTRNRCLAVRYEKKKNTVQVIISQITQAVARFVGDTEQIVEVVLLGTIEFTFSEVVGIFETLVEQGDCFLQTLRTLQTSRTPQTLRTPQNPPTLPPPQVNSAQ